VRSPFIQCSFVYYQVFVSSVSLMIHFRVETRCYTNYQK